MFRKALFVGLAFAMLLSFGLHTAVAAENAAPAKPDWLTKALTIIVPVSVGGNMDVKARLVAKHLPKYLDNVAVVVENKPGAGSITALTEYLVEPPNTTSLLYVSGSHMKVVPFYNFTMYTSEDFIPLYGTDEVANGLFVNPDKTGIRTIDDLKKYGEGRIVKFGATAAGDTFLLTKAFLTMAGLKSDIVDANSSSECLVNCLAGTVDVAYAGMNLGRDYVAEGKLQALAAFTEEPYTEYPGVTVPSFKENGYDMVYTAFSFFAIRKGTDQAVLDYITHALKQVCDDPEFQVEFARAGFVLHPDFTPEVIEAKLQRMEDDLKKYDALIE